MEIMRLHELIDAIEERIPEGWVWLVRKKSGAYFANICIEGVNMISPLSRASLLFPCDGESPEQALQLSFNAFKARYDDKAT